MILSTILLSAAACQEPQQAEVRVADLKAHIGFFTSEELEGREAGKRGGHLAASYIENQFRRLGLKPLGENGAYRLPFALRKDTAYNVVGVLQGTDPELSKKYIAIGGHHDHAGLGSSMSGAMGFPYEIHNGADDNASGASGVLELAEYYTAHPSKHSMIFMTFSAEERGLLGSKHLVKSGILPNDDILFMINLDMIGRLTDDKLFVGGLGTAAELHDRLDPIFEASKLKLELDDRGEAPSDNTSFFHAGIPALFFFTNIHEDYHMPSDDADRINYVGEVKVLNLAQEVIAKLDSESSLTFKDHGGMGMPKDFNDRMMKHYRSISQRKSMKGKLGVTAGDVVGNGLLVASVRDGSAADAAGMEDGDILLSINERNTVDMMQLRRALAGGLKGDEVNITVLRGETTVKLTAVLK